MTELATIVAFGKRTPGSQVQFTYRDPVQMINISLASTMPKNVACSLNKVAVYKEDSTFTKLQITWYSDIGLQLKIIFIVD